MRRRAIWSALLLAGWANAQAWGSPGHALAVDKFGAAPAWEGPQKIQGDSHGHVFLLRADSLEVYPVGKGGVLGKPTKLEAATPINAPVLDAVMGPGGSGDWLLRLPLEVRWFVDGKEKPLPPMKWRPWGVGYLRATPVVSVLPLPAPVNGIAVVRHGEGGPAKAPVVVELAGDRWSVLVEDAWPAQRDINTLTEGCARMLVGDHDGKLWAAHAYSYVLERYSPAGRSLGKVVAEEGRAEHVDVKDVSLPAEVRKEDGAHFRPFLGVLKISDLVEGLDHRLYLLVQAGKSDLGVSLDRYDPAQGMLERVTLGVELPGMATLAAGRDGLYLAGHAGNQGRGRISWDELDRAAWKKIVIQGEDLPVDTTGKGTTGRKQGKKTPSPAPHPGL
jgi:hypothetical protein